MMVYMYLVVTPDKDALFGKTDQEFGWSGDQDEVVMVDL